MGISPALGLSAAVDDEQGVPKEGPEMPEDLASPRRAARRALDLLRHINDAHSAALFRPLVDRLRLFVSVGIDQDALDLAQHLWDTRRNGLESGVVGRAPSTRPCGGTHLLIPLLQEGSLVALVYLDSSHGREGEPWDQPSLDHLAPTLAHTILLPGPDLAFLPQDLSAYLARISTRDMRRIHLLAQLEGNEWNVARTARKMGVARATIYEWMKKLDVPARPPRAVRGDGGRPRPKAGPVQTRRVSSGPALEGNDPASTGSSGR